mmetsp:Transcript_16319/g.24055  ORF Transcript_16319/g.24055 Transcript_16319/m.24055 type:complete len:285 (-) Transcript_16319:132-986(-)
MTSKLSNCYTPLPPSKKYEINRTNEEYSTSGADSSSSTVSSDARSYRALRQAHFTVSCFSNATGSSLVELGHTKVVCAVNGPHAAASGGMGRGPLEFHSEGKLNCQVSLPPTITQGIMNAGSSTNANQIDEAELSLNLKDAIYASVLDLEKFSKSVIDVHVRVLQDDGGILVAAIIAASLALADAGVECCDLVSACSVCVVPSPANNGDKLVCLVDPTEDEIELGQGYVTVALMPNRKEVTYWDQAGRLQSGITAEAIGICREGCHTMYKLMRQCLKTHSESLQ